MSIELNINCYGCFEKWTGQIVLAITVPNEVVIQAIKIWIQAYESRKFY